MREIDKIIVDATKRIKLFSLLDTAKNPSLAYYYARDVVKGRWLVGEPAIATDPEYAYWYAVDVVRGRWKGGEPVLARHPRFASAYAINAVKGRFIEGEKALANEPNDSVSKRRYLAFFPEAKEDWLLNGWVDWLDT
jgi:hypothetical protein